MDDGDVPRLIPLAPLERNPLIAYVQCHLVRPRPVPRPESFWDRGEVGGEHPLIRQGPPWSRFFRSVEGGEVVKSKVSVPEAGHVGVVRSPLGVELDTDGEEG